MAVPYIPYIFNGKEEEEPVVQSENDNDETDSETDSSEMDSSETDSSETDSLNDDSGYGIFTGTSSSFAPCGLRLQFAMCQ